MIVTLLLAALACSLVAGRSSMIASSVMKCNCDGTPNRGPFACFTNEGCPVDNWADERSLPFLIGVDVSRNYSVSPDFPAIVRVDVNFLAYSLSVDLALYSLAGVDVYARHGLPATPTTFDFLFSQTSFSIMAPDVGTWFLTFVANETGIVELSIPDDGYTDNELESLIGRAAPNDYACSDTTSFNGGNAVYVYNLQYDAKTSNATIPVKMHVTFSSGILRYNGLPLLISAPPSYQYLTNGGPISNVDHSANGFDVPFPKRGIYVIVSNAKSCSTGIFSFSLSEQVNFDSPTTTINFLGFSRRPPFAQQFPLTVGLTGSITLQVAPQLFLRAARVTVTSVFSNNIFGYIRSSQLPSFDQLNTSPPKVWDASFNGTDVATYEFEFSNYNGFFLGIEVANVNSLVTILIEPIYFCTLDCHSNEDIVPNNQRGIDNDFISLGYCNAFTGRCRCNRCIDSTKLTGGTCFDEAIGDDCGVLRCTSYTTCVQCGQDPSCSWSRPTGQCVPGAATSNMWNNVNAGTPYGARDYPGVNTHSVCDATLSWYQEGPTGLTLLPSQAQQLDGAYSATVNGDLYMGFLSPNGDHNWVRYRGATVTPLRANPDLNGVKYMSLGGNSIAIIVTGGLRTSPMNDNIYQYLIESDAWSQVSTTPAFVPLQNAAFVASFGDMFFAVVRSGGQSLTGGVLDDRIFYYCGGLDNTPPCVHATGNWEQATGVLDVPRMLHTMVRVPTATGGDAYFVYGGLFAPTNVVQCAADLTSCMVVSTPAIRPGPAPGPVMKIFPIASNARNLLFVYPTLPQAANQSLYDGYFDQLNFYSADAALDFQPSPAILDLDAMEWRSLPNTGPSCLPGCLLGATPSKRPGVDDVVGVFPIAGGHTVFARHHTYMGSIDVETTIDPPSNLLFGGATYDNGTHAIMWGGLENAPLQSSDYIQGIGNTGIEYQNVRVYDFETSSWTHYPIEMANSAAQDKVAMTRCYFASTFANNRLAVIGGRDSFGTMYPLDHLLTWDATDHLWRMYTTASNMSQFPELVNTFGGGLAEYGGKYYLAGGVAVPSLYADTIARQRIYEFTMDETAMTFMVAQYAPYQGSDLSVPQSALSFIPSTLQVGSKLILYGGFLPGDPITEFRPSPPGTTKSVSIPKAYANGGLVILDFAALANRQTDTGIVVRQAPFYRVLSSVVNVNGILFFFGGGETTLTATSSVFAYVPASDEWTTLQIITDATPHSLATVYHDGVLYTFGGLLPSPTTFTMINNVTRYTDGFNVTCASLHSKPAADSEPITLQVVPPLPIHNVSALNPDIGNNLQGEGSDSNPYVFCVLDGALLGLAMTTITPPNQGFGSYICTVGPASVGTHHLTLAIGRKADTTQDISVSNVILTQVLLMAVPIEFTPCAAGQFQTSFTSPCEKCPNGTFNPLIGGSCQKCGPGNYSDEGAEVCSPCQPGTYSSNDRVCTPCAQDTANPSFGAPSCPACTGSYYADLEGSQGCTWCGANSQRTPDRTCQCLRNYWGAINQGSVTCTACDLTRSTCPSESGQNEKPTPLPGYWRFDDGGYAMLLCASVEACPGGPNNTCGTGYTGTACARCVDHYYPLNGVCTPCPNDATIRLVIAVLVIVVAVFLLIKIASSMSGKGSRIGSFGTIGIAFSFIQLTAIFINLKLNWPPQLLNLFRIFSFLNLNIDIAAPECTINVGYRTKWGVTMLLPVFFGLVMLFVFFLAWLRYKFKTSLPRGCQECKIFSCQPCRGQTPQEFAHTRDTIGHAFLLFLSVGFMFMVSKTLEPLACTSQGNGLKFVAAYPGMQCYSGDWNTMIPFIVIGIIVYIAGIPALFFYILRWQFKKLQHTNLHIFKARFGFLIARYTRKYFFWEMMIMARKLAFVIFTTILVDSTIGQTIFGIIVLFAALLGQMFAWPYKAGNDNRLEALLLITDYLILLAGLIFFTQQGEALSVLAVIVIIIVILAGAVIALYILLEVRNLFTTFKFRELTSKTENNELLDDMEEVLRPLGYIEVLQWLKTAEGEDRERIKSIVHIIAENMRRGVQIEQDMTLVKGVALPYLEVYKKTADPDDAELCESFLEMVEKRLAQKESDVTTKRKGSSVLRRRSTRPGSRPVSTQMNSLPPAYSSDSLNNSSVPLNPAFKPDLDANDFDSNTASGKFVNSTGNQNMFASINDAGGFLLGVPGGQSTAPAQAHPSDQSGRTSTHLSPETAATGGRASAYNSLPPDATPARPTSSYQAPPPEPAQPPRASNYASVPPPPILNLPPAAPPPPPAAPSIPPPPPEDFVRFAPASVVDAPAAPPPPMPSLALPTPAATQDRGSGYSARYDSTVEGELAPPIVVASVRPATLLPGVADDMQTAVLLMVPPPALLPAPVEAPPPPPIFAPPPPPPMVAEPPMPSPPASDDGASSGLGDE